MKPKLTLSRGFKIFLSILILGLFSIQFLRVNYLSCVVESQRIILRMHPEFSFIGYPDNQGDDWYFRAQSATTTDQYTIDAAIYCGFSYLGNNPEVIVGKVEKARK